MTTTTSLANISDLVVAKKECIIDDLESFSCEEEGVLYVLDSLNRHKKVIFTDNQSETLFELVGELVRNNHRVTIFPGSRLISAKQAAEILGTSLSYLDNLASKGTLRFFEYEFQDVIKADTLFKFKDQYEKLKAKAFDETIGMDQEMYFYDQ